MCYSRRSYGTDERQAAKTQPSKETQNRQDERVDALLKEAHRQEQPASPEKAPARESVPAK